MSDNPLYEKYGQNFESGKIIFKEGEEGEQMFIIQEGKVRISKRVGEKEHTLAVLQKGDFFGEMAIVTRVKRSATATAVNDVQLLSFNRQGFQGMIEKNAKIALNIIDKLCRRLQQANMQIQHLVKRNERSLVALNLIYAFQELEEGDKTLQLDRTLNEISLHAEIESERIAQVLKDFQQMGILEIYTNSLRLLDSSKLNKIAEITGHAG